MAHDIILRDNGAGTFDIALAAAAQTLTATAITSAEAFGTGAITPGVVTLVASGIASQEAFGTGIVTVGFVTLVASSIASEEAFGVGTIAHAAPTPPPPMPRKRRRKLQQPPPPIPQTIYAKSIESQEAFGRGSVSQYSPTQFISVLKGISSTTVFGTPAIEHEPAQVVFASSIGSAVQFGVEGKLIQEIMIISYREAQEMWLLELM